jgi:hypothetical protein
LDDLPAIELLEATHEFPGPYTFKVIGHVADGFVGRVVEAVREELDVPDDPPYRLRQTASGSQVSVTVSPHIEAASQVLAIYRRIRQMPGLIMVW